MSDSFYPVTRDGSAHREPTLATKILAIALLVVAGALVWTVYQWKHQQTHTMSMEPRAIAQRPDDKLGADEGGTIEVFKKFSPSVVHVTNLALGHDRFTMNETEIPQGTGSGFVWDDVGGFIVTNFHVVNGAERASVTLKDGSTYPAKIVGTAPDKDLAVLHIDAPAHKLTKVPIGESSKLQVGQKVLAIGNPFGLDQTLTTGVISGLGREIKSISGRPITDVIQTDASINPGNSGGPLLDSSGRLIGINTAIYSPSGANAGIGFAVPVDTINQVVPQLIKNGKISRPGLGINTLNDLVAQQNGIDGVVIMGVQPGGAADAAGLVGARQLQSGVALGDVIVAIDGTEIHRMNDLFKVLDAHKVGDAIEVTVVNQGEKRTVKVTLQSLP